MCLGVCKPSVLGPGQLPETKAQTINKSICALSPPPNTHCGQFWVSTNTGAARAPCNVPWNDNFHAPGWPQKPRSPSTRSFAALVKNNREASSFCTHKIDAWMRSLYPTGDTVSSNNLSWVRGSDVNNWKYTPKPMREDFIEETVIYGSSLE